MRWLAWLRRGKVGRAVVSGSTGCPAASWWLIGLGWLVLLTPPGRGCWRPRRRVTLRGVGPGTYPRGGKIHLRLWLAERLADETGATNLAGAPWMTAVRARARRDGSARTSTCTRSRR